MLSTTSAYALRALVPLAGLQPGESLLGRELAMRTHVPSNYLSKILLVLRNAGIVEATRGKGGGYGLHREPEEIRLIEVVELFEGPRHEPICLLNHHRACSDEIPCSAHANWRIVYETYIRFLQTTTLADIACSSNGCSQSQGSPLNPRSGG